MHETLNSEHWITLCPDKSVRKVSTFQRSSGDYESLFIEGWTVALDEIKI